MEKERKCWPKQGKAAAAAPKQKANEKNMFNAERAYEFSEWKEDSIQLQKKLKAIIASDYTPNDSYLKRFVNEFGTHTRTVASEVVCVCHGIVLFAIRFSFASTFI